MTVEEHGAPGQWITVPEAAERMGISLRAVQKQCQSGKLKAQRITTEQGLKWEIDANELPKRRERTEKGGRERNEKEGAFDSSHSENGANELHQGRERNSEKGANELQAITGDVARLSGEVEQLKAFIAGGAMQAINERLAQLPDVDSLRAAMAENQQQTAQMMADAVEKGITKALQADVERESETASKDDVKAILEELRRVQDANTKLAHELADLRENQSKPGFFRRLLGG